MRFGTALRLDARARRRFLIHALASATLATQPLRRTAVSKTRDVKKETKKPKLSIKEKQDKKKAKLAKKGLMS
jgi:hypothetical protein